MTNYDYVQKTIELFEDSLEQGAPFTTTAALAARIGYSAHHIGRLFQSLCGESLGRYMLRRRLSRAAASIRDRQVKPSEAFLPAGWEDYTAFSRAVRREFGVSPSRLASLDSREISLAVRARPRLPQAPAERDLTPGIIQMEAFHVTGLVFFMGLNEKGFHKPWRIFTANRHRIRSVTGADTYQFSFWDEDSASEDDGLWIHCAVKTDPEAKQDMLFFSRTIPAMRLLSFLHTGPIETIHDTYRRIFSEYLPSSSYRLAGNLEFQRYSEDGSVHICLPVKEPTES